MDSPAHPADPHAPGLVDRHEDRPRLPSPYLEPDVEETGTGRCQVHDALLAAFGVADGQGARGDFTKFRQFPVPD